MLVEVAYSLYLGVQLFEVKETEAYFNVLDVFEYLFWYLLKQTKAASALLCGVVDHLASLV